MCVFVCVFNTKLYKFVIVVRVNLHAPKKMSLGMDFERNNIGPIYLYMLHVCRMAFSMPLFQRNLPSLEIVYVWHRKVFSRYKFDRQVVETMDLTAFKIHTQRKREREHHMIVIDIDRPNELVWHSWNEIGFKV